MTKQMEKEQKAQFAEKERERKAQREAYEKKKQQP